MIKIEAKKIFLFIISIILLYSCSNKKEFAYFQKQENQADTIMVASAYVPKIQPGDILSVFVNSLSPEASSFFNPYSMSMSAGAAGLSGSQGGSSTGSQQPSLSGGSASQSLSPGFLVDAQGDIELPLIGTIKMAGYTTIQARDTLKKMLKRYLKEPTVDVRIVNYKIAVLGEVARPSVYTIDNERITLPEALSIAGDLTVYARRDNIQIIRDVNGKKEFGRINLQSRDIFSSPYYYLHANDIVYVEPGKRKSESIDRTYQILPSVVSFLSLIVVIFRK